MSAVRRSARSGQRSAPSSSPPPAIRLDRGDPAAVGSWLRDVHTQARDVAEAGKDATRPPGQRELGRRAARRIITQASRKLTDLLRLTGVDLGEPPAAPADPRG